MKILVAYSSNTGNTKKLATGIYDSLKNRYEINLSNIEDLNNIEGYDLIIAGFWVDKGNANSQAKKFIKSIREKDVILVGTLGADPDSEHGAKVIKNIARIPHKSNRYWGGYICRGLVDPKLIKRIQSLPLPKNIKKRMYDSSVSSRATNADDIKKGVDFILDIIETKIS